MQKPLPVPSVPSRGPSGRRTPRREHRARAAPGDRRPFLARRRAGPGAGAGLRGQSHGAAAVAAADRGEPRRPARPAARGRRGGGARRGGPRHPLARQRRRAGAPAGGAAPARGRPQRRPVRRAGTRRRGGGRPQPRRGRGGVHHGAGRLLPRRRLRSGLHRGPAPAGPRGRPHRPAGRGAGGRDTCAGWGGAQRPRRPLRARRGAGRRARRLGGGSTRRGGARHGPCRDGRSARPATGSGRPVLRPRGLHGRGARRCSRTRCGTASCRR